MICIVHHASIPTAKISNPLMLYSVSGPTCEQDYQCEHGREYYQFDTHQSPPRLPIMITAIIMITTPIVRFI